MDPDEPESASCRLFATYELLENILSHLSTENLAQSQRVCRTWKDLIKRSQLLRQHLFLEPESCKEGKDANDVELQYACKGAFTPHPILLKHGSRTCRTQMSKWYCELNMHAIKRIRGWSDKHWTSMFIARPPLKEVSVFAYVGNAYLPAYEKDCRNSNGIKMEVLVDAIETMIEFVDKPDVENDFFFSVDIGVDY